MSTLRRGQNSRIQSLIDLIRDEAPRELLFDCIEASRRDQFVVRKYQKMSVTQMCDEPLFRVSSRPWTAVVDDDEFISHLISLYFTWVYPYYRFVDQEVFLVDMSSGDLSCSYCTPLLVNAILSFACVRTCRFNMCPRR